MGDCLRAYANSKGWSPEDYAILGSLNLDWDRLNILLAARAFNDKPTLPLLEDLEDYLEESLSDDPVLREAVQIFPNGYSGPETDLPHLLGEGDEDVSDELNEGRRPDSPKPKGRSTRAKQK